MVLKAIVKRTKYWNVYHYIFATHPDYEICLFEDNKTGIIDFMIGGVIELKDNQYYSSRYKALEAALRLIKQQTIGE